MCKLEFKHKIKIYEKIELFLLFRGLQLGFQEEIRKKLVEKNETLKELKGGANTSHSFIHGDRKLSLKSELIFS